MQHIQLKLAMETIADQEYLEGLLICISISKKKETSKELRKDKNFHFGHNVCYSDS